MITIRILAWDDDKSWTDWSGQAKRQLVNRLKEYGGMPLTETKRLARQILRREKFEIKLPKIEGAEGIRHVLESVGAQVVMDMDERAGTLPSPGKVVLIVDLAYGERLAAMPPHAPVWIIDSDANTPVVKRLWQERPKESHLTGITSFKARPGLTPEEQVIAVLEQIDLHHGEASTDTPYCTLEVIGCSIGDKIKDELHVYGFFISEASDGGFKANRLRRNREAYPRISY